jgi:hypothetical protein
MMRLQNKGQVIAICMRGYGNSSYNNSLKNFDELAEEIDIFMKETFSHIK